MTTLLVSDDPDKLNAAARTLVNEMKTLPLIRNPLIADDFAPARNLDQAAL